MLVCPNAIVAKSISLILLVLFTIPSASPGKSIPVILPKPNFLIYSFNFSAPNLAPNSINPTLHEFLSISAAVCAPCPDKFQQ